MVVEPGVRQKAVSLGALIVMIAKMCVFHPGVGVLTGDSVDFRAVATLDAVEFEAARNPFHLQVYAVIFLRDRPQTYCLVAIPS
jgi:hypothetical protein